jgi:ketosteroid isomerase-like protein
MKMASELLVAFLESVSDPEKAAGLFAEHSAFEAPYLATIGLPPRVVGREGVAALLAGLLKTVPTLAFPKPEILIDTGDQAFAEYSADTVTVDGRPFRQLYATRVVAREGFITLMRESLDSVRAAQALLPNGLADVPDSH